MNLYWNNLKHLLYWKKSQFLYQLVDFSRNFHFIKRKLLLLFVSPLLFILGLIFCGFISYPLLFTGEQVSDFSIFGINYGGDYRHWHEKRARPLFVDNKQRVIGLYPGAVKVSSPYISMRYDEIPQKWWEMVKLLEDGNQERFYHFLGVDYSQFLKIPYHILTGQGSRGGSTLTMQLVKTMQTDQDSHTFNRKIRDIIHATTLSLYLEEEEKKIWFARHVPLLYGGNEQGLAVASLIIFGKLPVNLTLSEQSLLAAAIKYRIKPNSTAQWKRIKIRAQHALSLLLKQSPKEKKAIDKAFAELNRLKLPNLNNNFQLNSCKKWKASSTLLGSRAIDVGWGEIIQAAAELRQWSGRDWWKNTSLVELTLDMKKNCKIRKKIEKKKDSLFRELSIAQQDKKVEYPNTLKARDKKRQVYTSLVLADKNARIQYYYGQPYFAYYNGYTLGKNLYDSHFDTTKIGSTGKVIAAVLAGKEGDLPNSQYFVKRKQKIVSSKRESNSWFQNAIGQTENDRLGYFERKGNALISSSQAYATSNNLAVLERMDRLKNIDLFQVVTDFGFTVLKNNDIYFNRDYRIDIPMGNILGSARTIHRMMHVVAKTGFNLPNEMGCSPFIVEHVQDSKQKLISMHQNAKHVEKCRKISSYLNNDSTKEFVTKVLSGVVKNKHQNSGYNGTAKGLAKWSEDNINIRKHIAKTGTTSYKREVFGSKSATLHATVTGALVKKNGEFYSYLVQIGPRGSGVGRTLGPYVYGGHAAKLMIPVLEEIIRNQELSSK